MKRAKVTLVEKRYENDELDFEARMEGLVGVCLTMLLKCVADFVVEDKTSVTEVTTILKGMVKSGRELKKSNEKEGN